MRLLLFRNSELLLIVKLSELCNSNVVMRLVAKDKNEEVLYISSVAFQSLDYYRLYTNASYMLMCIGFNLWSTKCQINAMLLEVRDRESIWLRSDNFVFSALRTLP